MATTCCNCGGPAEHRDLDGDSVCGNCATSLGVRTAPASDRFAEDDLRALETAYAKDEMDRLLGAAVRALVEKHDVIELHRGHAPDVRPAVSTDLGLIEGDTLDAAVQAAKEAP